MSDDYKREPMPPYMPDECTVYRKNPDGEWQEVMTVTDIKVPLAPEDEAREVAELEQLYKR